MNKAEQRLFGREYKESPFDPIKAREEIRQNLKDALPEMRQKSGGFEKDSPLSFVFEASLEDGLDAARELRLSPEEIQRLTLKGGLWFYEKHKKVFDIAVL